MHRIEVADPSLVVLIGAAGAGKTTFAARHFAADEILSSDAYREMIAGDPGNQRATGIAFRRLHETLARRLRDGRLTVVDATNVRAANRRPLLTRARLAGVPVAAIVLDLPRTEVLARNARRDRVVATDVVDRQLDWLRQTLDGDQLAVEGVDPVVILRSPADVAGLVVERRPLRRPC